MITVKVQDLAEGRDFPCPICGNTICFHFSQEELHKMIDIAKKNQERALRRQFPLAFGDV